MFIHIPALVTNLRLVASRQPRSVAYFYDYLFRRHPTTKVLFPTDEHSAGISAALLRVLQGARTEAELADLFENIGERHRDQGVTKQMYAWAADALLSILILGSAEDWTPALHGAWRMASSQIVDWLAAGKARPGTAPPGSSAPYLIVLAGPARGEIIRLVQSVTIGSGDRAELRIQDDRISSQHARVVPGSLATHLTDLHSVNRTRLNGDPISKPMVLTDGDVISLGADTLILFTSQPSVPGLSSTPRNRITSAWHRRPR
jgi:hemoglobin-like flavoprotein